MAGSKRSADESGESSAKVGKVARTERNGDGAKNSPKKATPKVALSSSDFKAKALPLHLNLTHTPPTVQKENDVEVEVAEANTTAGDIGSIGNLTLVPNIFNTGSYGWKGSKHITVELQDGEAGPGGGKEKVQVMLTVNATVMGSKPKKLTKGKRGKDEGVTEENAEDVQD